LDIVTWAGRLGLKSERAVLFAIAGVVPLLVAFLVAITFWTSLTKDVPGLGVTYTLNHYFSIYGDPFTYRALFNTLGFAVTTVLVALTFGIPIAWMVERTDCPHKEWLYMFMVMSLVIPTFFVAMGWILLLHPRMGFLNTWLRALSDSPGFTINITTVMGMGFVEGISLAPLAFVMTAAGFRAMNPALEEAAHVHGMGRWSSTLYITLPLLFPSILAASIYIFVIGLAAFDVPAVIGLANRIYTFSTLVYVKALTPEGVPQYGIPAAVGMLMFIVALGFTWWYSRILRFSRRYEIVSGRAYQAKRTNAGRWAIVGWAFCAVYLLLGIGIPLLLVIWAAITPYLQPPSMRALGSVSLEQFSRLPWDLVLHGALNTLLLMLLVPTVVVGLCIPIAWVIIRSGSRWRYTYEFLVFLPHAMPAIVFGVAALVASLFILKDMIPLYGTIWIIGLVYVVERISFGSRVINGALIQIHRELEEVGYVSGLSIASVLKAIFLPLLRPAIFNAWLWMALITYRELTIAAVLFTPANITLPVVVWNLWTAGGMGPAAAVTLVMLAILTPLVFVYWTGTSRRVAGW
jgi:iron(III) transport system permease protein